MKMTASEAYAIARDAKEIIKFREKMDEKIHCAACNGKFDTQEYIPWTVSDEAVEAVADEYADRGYAVDCEPRENQKNAIIDCGNYSERLIRISWKAVKV